MIGNTDWKIRFLHNIKLIATKDSSQKIVIPYDFDFSGIVDASYALPNPDYNQKKVRDRIFQGLEVDPERMEMVLEEFILKKEVFREMCNSLSFLSKKERKKTWKYLNSFFKIIENKDKRKEVFFE